MATDGMRELVACIPQLRRYARGLLYDREQADDLVQDTLERAWTKLSQWQAQRGELRPWAFSIMHNLFVDQLRGRRHQLEEAAGQALPDQVQAATQTDGLALRDLDRMLQRLPPDHREVLLLVAVEGLTYEQTAAVLQVPVGTVMSRLSRARARLRADMEGRTAPPRMQRVK